MNKLNGGTLHRNIEYSDAENKSMNPKIIALNKQFTKTNDKLTKIRKEIINLQANCKHEFYLIYNSPAYDDCYRCINCGKEEWF